MERLYRPVAVVLVVAAVVWTWLVPSVPASVDPDHAIYLETVAAMRDGSSYYEAMDQQLRGLYGGPAGSVVAFRLPTVFLMWRWLPTGPTWPLFVSVVAVGGGLVAARISRPVAGLLVAAWLLALGYPHIASGWHAQWAVVEFWAVPAVLAAVWRYQQGDDPGAAAFATIAALVRELAVPVLGVGLLLAWRDGRRRWPWLGGVAIWVVVVALHARAAWAHLGAPGAEPALLGTADATSVFTMATVTGSWVFFIAWVAAVGVVLWERRWLIAPLVGLPFLGLLVDRSYWGILTVPVVLTTLLDVGRRGHEPTPGAGGPSTAVGT